MADNKGFNKGYNPYLELYEQLQIPERLKPENIAAFLNEHISANADAAKRRAAISSAEKIAPSSEHVNNDVVISETQEIRVTSNDIKTPRIPNKHHVSVAYRAVASVAACAALVFGVIKYTGIGEQATLPQDLPGGGTYASDYDDVHRTFEKYFIDDTENKKTLDSVIADIEHSYNTNPYTQTPGSAPSDGDPVVSQPSSQPDTTATDNPVGDSSSVNPPETTPVVPDDEPSANPEPVSPAEPDHTEPVPTPTNPGHEIIDDSVPLPPKGGDSDGTKQKALFGNGCILVRDENMIRVITNRDGQIEYTDNIFPIYIEGAQKTLVDFFVEGTRVAAVYSSVGGVMDDYVGTLYSGTSRSSVEVNIYDVATGRATLVTSYVQNGNLVDMTFSNGALYLAAAYSDYRIAPIVGVDDLESYVPSYSLNGEKIYVQASDIMIPDYISNTDYTVISGVTMNGGISVKAVLGYEGRVIVENNAVYLFGYDSQSGADSTSVKVFSLTDGSVVYAGYTEIAGIALGGDGITTFGGAIAVTSIRQDPEGYTTTIGVYDATMNMISFDEIPGAFTSAKRVDNIIYLSGSSESCSVDLTDPKHPVILNGESQNDSIYDSVEGLKEFGDGYVTLTKNEAGELQLAKISSRNGELRLDYKTVICSDGDIVSKALDDNMLLFVSGDYVGVPYGYYDGFDYCYRYGLYAAYGSEFVKVGEIENHETDEAFENGKAILSGGILYIFSDGRIYSAAIGDTLSVIDTAQIIESAYSGH